YGGMENTTATVMADTRLVVDARTALDYDPQPLIAHELAHQWTGDYVTYADWRNEWLNEGFATFLQQMWTKERFGFEDFLLQRFNGIRSYVDWTDRDGRLPVVHRTSTSSANTYSKGAAVLHMMMDILGEKDFRRVLNAWLVRHAYGSVETNDLKRTIEEVTGRNLQWFFEQWLYKAGYPEIEITREPLADGSGLRIMYRQVQKTDSLCGYFRMPIDVWILQPDAGQDCVQILSKSIAGPETADTIPVPAGKYFVLFDPTRGICGRVHVDYTAAERAALLVLSLDEPEAHGKFIPAPWRILLAERLAADAGAMVQERIRSILFDIAERDPVPEVRKAVATKLAEISPQAVDYADDLREVFLRLRRDPFSGVRATAVNGLNNFRDAALLPFFRDMLTDSSYFVEASAMNGILALDSTGAVDILRMRLQSRSYQDVLALAALDWVRRYRLSSLQDLVLNLAGPGHSAPLRAKAFETLLDLRVAAERIRELILRQLEEPRAAFRLYAVSALQLFGKEEARRVLGSRLPLEDNPRVRALIRELYQL
ncbi:MAG: HEAT repeat domain-containing protein, partial [Bacteroidetes bacterium]|nr:HEAT repeat domain-containing protein [Bacteroidota bacterium]